MQNNPKLVCGKTLPCGHRCNGVQGEEKCLPCLHGCSGGDINSKLQRLTLKSTDNCAICNDRLSCAPCIKLECDHVFHYHCCEMVLTKQWFGPQISFRFMFCPVCKSARIEHPKLQSVLDPINALYEDVERKCLQRLEYENKTNCEALTTSTSKYYQKPFEYAMSIYSYYVCFKCKKSYYGGEVRCAEQAEMGDKYNPSELVCGQCTCSPHDQAKVCAKHGEEFLQYKCRFCCSIAVFFCFGTTHFCNSCHNDHQRLTKMKSSEFPQCPVAPCAKPMEGKECPLHVQHPQTGEEFILGCGLCRNAQTF